MAIQLRTWRDFKYFQNQCQGARDSVVDCLLKRLLSVTNRVKGHICVFFASDDAAETATVMTRLQENLRCCTMMLDWMLLSEADEAVCTLGSTFGRSARMRRGHAGQEHDHLIDTKPFATKQS